MASRLQRAMSDRRIGKAYLAILTGELASEVTVDQPIGDDTASPVFVKSAVQPDGQPAVTRFEPQSARNGFTLARVVTMSGRKHQIRVHAQWLGFPLVGDKIYGPDETLYLQFIKDGVTKPMLKKLLLPRHALHAERVSFLHSGTRQPCSFQTPLPDDMETFLSEHA